MSERDPVDELSDLFVFLADNDFADYCPIYEIIARSVATDPALLRAINEAAHPNTRRGRVPVLFFAATHDLALANPSSELAAVYRGDSSRDVMAAFRHLIDEHWPTLVTTMRSHSVQTNEVGRSAVLALALTQALRGISSSPTFFEIGPSAGLNLFVDEFAIDFQKNGETIASIGRSSSPVQLRCELRGPNTPTLPATVPTPALRSGMDPNPIDVTSTAQCRWLQACVWPGIPDRPERLRSALEVARLDPPSLLRGDAVTDLEPALVELPDSHHLIVFSTWALAYVTEEGRQRILDVIDRLGRQRDLDFITFEEPRFTPWIDDLDHAIFESYRGDGTPTLLGLRSWRGGTEESTALAIAHPHGRWIHWCKENHG